MTELTQLNAELRRLNRDYLSSPAGDAFIKKLEWLIDEEHKKAENNPELASHFTSRAAGIRTVKSELIAISQEAKQK